MEKSSLYLASTWKLCSLTTPQAIVAQNGEVVELPLLMICVLLYLSLREVVIFSYRVQATT